MEERRRGPRRLLVHIAHTWMPLPAGEWVIGRAPESDIRIDDDRVSRRHGVVRSLPGGWELADGGSLNGIWVDGRQVQRVAVPPGGLTVRFGGKDGVPVRLLPDHTREAADPAGLPGDGVPVASAPAPGTSPVGVRFHEVTPGWSPDAEPEPADEAEPGRLRSLVRRVGKRTAGPGGAGPAAG